ncbi:MAG: LmeA family phospholipid-binding protein [Firmicutes bacterium]|nr:LmeA family phospholipid-binding protein [Bacillota bacterium]
MSRAIQALVVLAVLAGILQWFVPRWTARALASAMARYVGGRPPSVTLTAVPFWELASGRFQELVVGMHSATLDGLSVHAARLVWSDGAVSVRALTHGRVVITRPGHLTVSVSLTDANLSALLTREQALSDPSVSVTQGAIALRGRLNLGHEVVPLDAVGALSESANHETLIYHPEEIDGLRVPLLTNVSLVNLKSLPLPVPLYIEQVTLSPGQLELTVGNRLTT